MLEGDGQRINDIDVYEAAVDPFQHEQQRVNALHAQKQQISQTYDESLDRTGRHKQQPSSEVGTRRIQPFA